jgi:hypothetical protein
MRTFRIEPRFDPRTGKPAEPQAVETGAVLCDYSATPINAHGGEGHLVEYETPDVSGCEEFWDQDELSIDGRPVDVRALNGIQPRLAFIPAVPSPSDGSAAYNAEMLLMLEWRSERDALLRKETAQWDGNRDPRLEAEETAIRAAEDIQDARLHAVLKELGLPPLPDLAKAETFAQAMHLARYRAIRKAVADGRTPDELGLTFRED